MSLTTKLLPSRSSNLGILQLNNPSALNALTIDMVRALNAVLPQWHSDPTLRATLMDGAHGKRPAFCAGGDVRSVYESGQTEGTPSEHGYGKNGLLTADFFREEYLMNYRVATQDHSNCPQISIWDGVVMGGGVGCSVHGKYRVATEHTLFSMPETAIGLFPDVGGMWWLPRLRGGLGPYLALTGKRLGASDLMYAGIATHYIPSTRLEELHIALVDATNTEGEGDCVAGVLLSFHEEVDKLDSFLAKNRDGIDRAFENKAAIEDIVISLESLETDFGKETLATLTKMSPTSLKVTLEGLRRGAELPDIGAVLRMEYRMSQGFMREGSDFYEGIRAVLVEKDHSPKWNPGSLEELTEDTIQTYFGSLGENELSLESDADEGQSRL